MSDVINATVVVEFVSTKNGKYSIKGSDGNWYGCYTNDPECSKGDEVKFDYKMNGDFRNVVKGTVKVIGHTAPAEQPSGEASKGSYTPSKSNNVYDVGSYWKAKFDDGVLSVNPAIRNQEARKAAVTVVMGALAAGNLDLPKSQGKQLEKIINFIGELTEQFCEETVEYVDMQNQELPEESEDE